MRLQRGLSLLAAVLISFVVSACGSSGGSSSSSSSSSSVSATTSSTAGSTASSSSSSSPASSGASVGSPAMRSELEQEIMSTASIKAPEAKKIVNCIIDKLTAAGITTDAEAASHETELSQLSTNCAEQIASGG
jgi:hypothetical protein